MGMSTILEIPKLPSTVVLDPPLTDEEFEKLCAANDFARLERTKEGKIVVNAPQGEIPAVATPSLLPN